MKPQMNTDKHRWIILGLIIVLGVALTTETTENTEILIVDLSKSLPENPYQTEYERMLYPTVRIKTLNSTGSGVIFHRRGAEDAENTIYILTAAHVVGNESTVTVEFFSHQDTKTPSSSCLSAFVAITDTAKDLALIKPSRALPYRAQLAPESYTPYIFCPVYAVGCSLGLTPRPSSGIISVIHRRDAENAENYWEITSPILPGNSGGPVFDARTYEVIGVAIWVHTYKNQIITTMAGIVPIQDIYTFLKSVPTE